jgi:uncharacterized membrane protein
MTVLILGLVLFLGSHSVRIFAEDWRSRQIAKLGEAKWKGLYSVVSIVGFGLVIWGYGLARAEPTFVWVPPPPLRHLAGLLNLLAFVSLAAAYVPGNHIKARLGHPMVLSVKIWALAHLLAIGTLHAIVLFGAFLVWAIANFAAARRRDLAAQTTYRPGTLGGTAITVAVGVAAGAVFAFALHGWLIGVRPFG